MGRETNIQDFVRHLGEFTKDAKGPALMKEGKSHSYEYRFADQPLSVPCYSAAASILTDRNKP